jgi:hypothetical protein
MLVCLPEETPVNELIETAYRFEDLVGVALAPVVVNAYYPVLSRLLTDPVAAAVAAKVDPPCHAEAVRLAAAANFRVTRQELQAAQVARLCAGLPLPQLRLPFEFTADLGPEELGKLSEALGTAIEQLSAGDSP